MLVKQGVDLFFGDQRMLITHLEFSDVCNRHCSYCIEGNGNPHRVNDPFSDEAKLLKVIDNIFAIIQPDDFMTFIIAGGEPTLQPSLPTIIAKIQSRKNTAIILTTNFTQSVAFYRQLNIPLIASLHLEENNIDEFITKIESLYDLIAHVRIMACPELFELFKEACLKVGNLHKRLPLNISTETISPCKGYSPIYSWEYFTWLKQNFMRTVVEYPPSLNTKLQLARGICHVPSWWTLIEGKPKQVPGFTTNFKNMYCERNFISIEKTGKLTYWCHDPKINVFELEAFPKNLFSNIVCTNTICPLSFPGILPKYKSKDYAPRYIQKMENQL
jgi:hypothetical protein